jgi:hypothetical protein
MNVRRVKCSIDTKEDDLGFEELESAVTSKDTLGFKGETG